VIIVTVTKDVTGCQKLSEAWKTYINANEHGIMENFAAGIATTFSHPMCPDARSLSGDFWHVVHREGDRGNCSRL